MATVHIREIQTWLRERDRADGAADEEGMFFEIRFDEPHASDDVADEEMRNEVITAEAPQGSVVITFDDAGMLRSIDIS